MHFQGCVPSRDNKNFWSSVSIFWVIFLWIANISARSSVEDICSLLSTTALDHKLKIITEVMASQFSGIIFGQGNLGLRQWQRSSCLVILCLEEICRILYISYPQTATSSVTSCVQEDVPKLGLPNNSQSNWQSSKLLLKVLHLWFP